MIFQRPRRPMIFNFKETHVVINWRVLQNKLVEKILAHCHFQVEEFNHLLSILGVIHIL